MHALTQDEILFLKSALKMYANENFKRLPNNVLFFCCHFDYVFRFDFGKHSKKKNKLLKK